MLIWCSSVLMSVMYRESWWYGVVCNSDGVYFCLFSFWSSRRPELRSARWMADSGCTCTPTSAPYLPPLHDPLDIYLELYLIRMIALWMWKMSRPLSHYRAAHSFYPIQKHFSRSFPSALPACSSPLRFMYRRCCASLYANQKLEFILTLPRQYYWFESPPPPGDHNHNQNHNTTHNLRARCPESSSAESDSFSPATRTPPWEQLHRHNCTLYAVHVQPFCLGHPQNTHYKTFCRDKRTTTEMASSPPGSPLSGMSPPARPMSAIMRPPPPRSHSRMSSKAGSRASDEDGKTSVKVGACVTVHRTLRNC